MKAFKHLKKEAVYAFKHANVAKRVEDEEDKALQDLIAERDRLIKEMNSNPVNNKDEFFRLVYNDAYKAGLDAGNACIPEPMNVSDGKAVWHVADGACGFAWIVIKPGTSAFARWLVRNDYASKAYHGGIQIWISEHNQSIMRKEAHARAMANVLREKLTLSTVYVESRLD
jgi:hypothetical protein